MDEHTTVNTKDYNIAEFDFYLDSDEKWKDAFDYFNLGDMRSKVLELLKPYSSSIKFFSSLIESYIKSNAMYIDEIEYIACKFNISILEVIVLQLIYELSNAQTRYSYRVRDVPQVYYNLTTDRIFI